MKGKVSTTDNFRVWSSSPARGMFFSLFFSTVIQFWQICQNRLITEKLECDLFVSYHHVTSHPTYNSFFKFLAETEGPLTLLFQSSGDVCARFQSRSMQPYTHLVEAYVIYIYSLRFTSDVYGQHSGQSLSTHACFKRSRLSDLN